MKNLSIAHVSAVSAEVFAEKMALIGYPTEDRVVIITTTGEQVTASGLLIPDAVVKELPKKGTIIQIGHITESNYAFKTLKVGDLITYGHYAGKELEFEELELDPAKHTLSVLSLNEIIYIQKQ